MPKRTLHALVGGLLVLIGFLAGVAAAGFFSTPAGLKTDFVESREGARRFVNPLLECELADGVVRNRVTLPFKEKVAAVLASRLKTSPGSASVYFRELNDGMWFSIGDAERFVPASLRKLPLMIAILKMAEGAGGRAALEQLVTNDLSRDYNREQNIKPSLLLEPGRRYTILELIRRSIAYSDNNAFMLLSRIVDPRELARAYALLHSERPGEEVDGQYQSAYKVASYFRILYNATYLGQDLSELALEILSQSEFKSGLVGGVPAEIVVAHKFGERSDLANGAVQLHDCGIVYFPGDPYLLCVMSRGADFGVLDDLIADVSRVVFEQVRSQHRPGDVPAPTPP